MENDRIYLETYVLQKDMRVRMPKALIANLNLKKGCSKFDIYLDIEAKEIILKLCSPEESNKNQSTEPSSSF